MDIKRNIGKVLLHLDNAYYEKGMKKISISVKGVRANKLAEVNRKIILPQILHSKEGERFISQFLRNLQEEFDQLQKEENIQKILETPDEDTCLEYLESADKELLYLYLIQLQEEKYDAILEKLFYDICEESTGQSKEKSHHLEKELENYKKSCENYEKEISELSNLLKQRKERIKDLELKNNILEETVQKLEKEKVELKEKAEFEKSDLLRKIEQLQNSLQEISTKKEPESKEKKKIVFVGNEKILGTIKREGVLELSPNDYIAKAESQQETFEEVWICKKDIPIAKLRKIKNFSKNVSEVILIFESKQELLEHMKAGEE